MSQRTDETETRQLNRREMSRYSRHILLDDVGLEGQQKLKAAKVLLIGAGGLGSPAALYLTAAGIGTLGLVEFDKVELSNLQRQILHHDGDIGTPKIESAKTKLTALNPEIRIQTHEVRIAAENAMSLIKPYDIVVDGSDNFATRYLVNDCCVLLGKPLIYGSILGFHGQASVFHPPSGPCYRCIFPEPPPPGSMPNCAEGGVLGILPGLIGTIQATETVKLILGKGQSLLGRFLLYDALAMTFQELQLARDQHCPLCGESPTIKELVDPQEFCGVFEKPVPEVPTLSPQQLAEWRSSEKPHLLVDVRSAGERQICTIEGSLNIPLATLKARLEEFTTDQEIVVHCRSGIRSAEAVQLLLDNGFPKAKSLDGGILAWIADCDHGLAPY